MARSDLRSRRQALGWLGAAGLALPLAACGKDQWYGIDVSGTLPDLDFALTRARDGAAVTETDYRGQVVALYFGYTFCPDVCPMTLANMAAVVEQLGDAAAGLSVLFVTVDPERDTPAVLTAYAATFSGRTAGLWGNANQLASVTRRYRVTYKVAPHRPGDADYAVSHGKSVYIFDARGKARLIWPEFDTTAADVDAATGDMRRLLGGG